VHHDVFRLAGLDHALNTGQQAVNQLLFGVGHLVSTGATLEANGLREVEVIYRSKACLIQRDGEMAGATTSSRRSVGACIMMYFDSRAWITP
jgi:hypothetical protein